MTSYSPASKAIRGGPLAYAQSLAFCCVHRVWFPLATHPCTFQVCDPVIEGVRAAPKKGQVLVHFFVTNKYGVVAPPNVLPLGENVDKMRLQLDKKPGFKDALTEAEQWLSAPSTSGPAATKRGRPTSAASSHTGPYKPVVNGEKLFKNSCHEIGEKTSTSASDSRAKYRVVAKDCAAGCRNIRIFQAIIDLRRQL